MAWERLLYKGDNVAGRAHERSRYVCAQTDTASPGWAHNTQRKVSDKQKALADLTEVSK